MYDMIPSLSVPMSPQCHALPTQEEMLVCQFQVNEDPFYLVTVWPEGQGKAQLAACEAGDFLESYLDELARLIKLFYPKNVD